MCLWFIFFGGGGFTSACIRLCIRLQVGFLPVQCTFSGKRNKREWNGTLGINTLAVFLPLNCHLISHEFLNRCASSYKALIHFLSVTWTFLFLLYYIYFFFLHNKHFFPSFDEESKDALQRPSHSMNNPNYMGH